MDDDEYYSLQHKHQQYKIPAVKSGRSLTDSAPRQTWQGREDEEMLREKQSSWSAKKDDNSADYSGSDDSE